MHLFAPLPPPPELTPTPTCTQCSCFALFEDGHPVVFYDECQQFHGSPCKVVAGGVGQHEDDTCASVLVPIGETIVLDSDALTSERASVVKYFSEIFKDLKFKFVLLKELLH